MTSSLMYFTIVILVAYSSATPALKVDLTKSNNFQPLPRFWTNTGFCPMGKINNDDIISSLLSDDVHTNLELISALPNMGLSHVRIHWLLELIRFIKFAPNQIPVYDFTYLDEFLDRIVQANLSVGFELMGNPDRMFNARRVSKGKLWEDIVFSIVRRYKIRYGIKTITSWRFETWNEPDLKTYNLLNFTLPDYLEYAIMVRRALDAGSRTANNTYFELSGPGGLFKNYENHPLCWGLLYYCDKAKKCPLDRLTFHRKGHGSKGKDILAGELDLIQTFQKDFPRIKDMKFSNNEADPIAGWSTPRPFQSDIRYAVTLIRTVLEHWTAKLNTPEFKNLDTISHDNAFLSYHPYEFDQRTLLARFQMNESQPRHSQFIQKPVYGALGLLGQLAELAENTSFHNRTNITYLVTKSRTRFPFYSAVIFIVEKGKNHTDFNVRIKLPKPVMDEHFATIIEVLEQDITDPVKIWNYYGSPSYPNATVRRMMRMHQGPMLVHRNVLKSKTRNEIHWRFNIRPPWITLLRTCSSKYSVPSSPIKLRIRAINPSEILLVWMESVQLQSNRCIKTYQIFFKTTNRTGWKQITSGQHIPFLSYHFQPDDGIVSGLYKVRSIDIFGRNGTFSEVVESK